jgi:hypothetical protein
MNVMTHKKDHIADTRFGQIRPQNDFVISPDGALIVQRMQPRPNSNQKTRARGCLMAFQQNAAEAASSDRGGQHVTEGQE